MNLSDETGAYQVYLEANRMICEEDAMYEDDFLIEMAEDLEKAQHAMGTAWLESLV